MSAISKQVFFDTNILVYAIDFNDPRKQSIARDLMRSASHPVISTQVLAEFYSVATRKLNMDKLVAKRMVEDFAKMVHSSTDAALVERTVDISILSQISFWDAMVVAAAEEANCGTLYSEDLGHGQKICGIEVVNPFA